MSNRNRYRYLKICHVCLLKEQSTIEKMSISSTYVSQSNEMLIGSHISYLVLCLEIWNSIFLFMKNGT